MASIAGKSAHGNNLSQPGRDIKFFARYSVGKFSCSVVSREEYYLSSLRMIAQEDGGLRGSWMGDLLIFLLQ